MSTSMTAGMIGPEANAAEQSRMELQARLNGLGGLNGRKLDPEAKAKKLREACEGFESIFIQKMWQEMRNAVPKTGLMTSREESYWQDMYDQELSKSMTKSGGIGLADMMYEQLSRNLVSASRSAAGSAIGGAFVPTAAPILQETAPVAEDMPTAAQLSASIYDGEAPQAGIMPEQQTLQTTQTVQAAQANPTAAPLQATAQAAAPVAQAQPGQPHVAEQATAAKPVEGNSLHHAAANTAHTAKTGKKIHAADLGQSQALLNAQKAKRDAGDKLGSRTVRPSQNKISSRKAAAAQADQPLTAQNPSFAPGSAEALRAAMEMAKTGTSASSAAQPVDLNNLVANLQAGNSQMAAAPATAAETSEPVTRKVRFTTNVPQNSKNSKKAKQAIRTLNVDNVGANSRAGQGLAAYHAQQAAAIQANGNVQPVSAGSQATQGIEPLTAQNQTAQASNEAGFAIPPLTAADSRI